MKQRILLITVLALTLSLPPFGPAWANGASSPGQAASVAKSMHGGKVLSSKDAGKAYRVKLLLDNGRVKTVTVSKGQ